MKEILAMVGLRLQDFKIDFKINPEQLKPGLTTNVDLFVIDVSDDCKADGVNDINDWYAAYVSMPEKCSQMEVIRQLQSDGADFIFLFDKNDEYSKLNSRALMVPVFPLVSKGNYNIGPFMKQISQSTEKAKKEHPDDKNDPSKRNSPVAKLFITIPHRPSKNDNAELSFVYSPANIRSFEYVSALSPVYTRMKEYITFEPILVVYKRPTSNTKVDKNCYKSSPYCAADPDGDGPFGGYHVILASLRQKCIFKDDKSKWFTYLECFGSSCKNDFSDACHTSCLKKSGTSEDKIEECIKNSELGNGNENSILKSDYSKMQNLLHDMTYPVLVMNGNTYRVALK